MVRPIYYNGNNSITNNSIKSNWLY